VQHKLSTGPAEPTKVREIAAAGLQGTSSSIPYLGQIQQSFGAHDIRGVHSHTDSAATAANQQMGSEGYAMGAGIAFATSAPSLHTVAHEAAHVVQQRAGVHLKNGVGTAGDAYEQHADRVADLVVQGRSAEQELSLLGASTATPAVQHQLKLTGSSALRQRALVVMNRGIFGFTAQADTAGLVTLVRNTMQGPPSPQQQAMYNYLNQIINDSHVTTVSVQSGSDATLVGSYATGNIDIADIEAMVGGSGATDVGSLIHELIEQYHKQVNSTGYGGEATGAHHEGIVAENAVNGSTRGPQRVVSAAQNPDGTLNAVVEIPYTFPNSRVVTTTLTIVRGSITSSVNRETTPARTP
jgi:hypothetical protein